MAFLRQMQPEDTKTRGMFANSGSHMLEKPLEINVPTNTLAYAVAFRDPNPIHRSKVSRHSLAEARLGRILDRGGSIAACQDEECYM
ncbi:hypothetical protein PC116_g12181 [Phytophthora cactorum]|uniref:Uncharacterized protein n=1 Tax=Phytophthora cactorum TaxID=29920 RepID=A0A8T1BIC1_9STRA|nr:hypothetical protein Pcac1_g17771 [Phytophthora cactorum]KAG2850901.1 hypothetical protein PC113_g16370 [Phytophthora cactorum]KAG2903818.1 hypothetical protein PC117_g21176 [Phytophthora cactorum]KAG4239826.1 hypothetical protein PC116_g12181 [Phytophthora cactorum]